MSVLNKIAFYQNRRDEVPNQQLAKELAETENTAGIKEIAMNLHHKNKSVQSDCLKVLYETGYIKPDLIADYVHEFLALLKSKNNRMVWGAMIALATIADKKPNEIYTQLNTLTTAINTGTLITTVWGVKALAKVAAANQIYKQKIFPLLMAQLRKCIPRDVPMHAESVLPAVDANNKQEFLSTIATRKPEMSPAQLARLKKTTKIMQKIVLFHYAC
ncbi:hypothetical protein MUP38_06140 [Candidatus Bathyarchaeota archaeon]|nr:hypothetical protein [Candidatus Bathyarchaeota archaeon]